MFLVYMRAGGPIAKEIQALEDEIDNMADAHQDGTTVILVGQLGDLEDIGIDFDFVRVVEPARSFSDIDLDNEDEIVEQGGTDDCFSEQEPNG